MSFLKQKNLFPAVKRMNIISLVWRLLVEQINEFSINWWNYCRIKFKVSIMIYPRNMLHHWAWSPYCHVGQRWPCRAGWSTFSDPAFLLVWSGLRAGRLRNAAWSGWPSQNEGRCWQTGACWPPGHGSYSWRSPARERKKRGVQSLSEWYQEIFIFISFVCENLIFHITEHLWTRRSSLNNEFKTTNEK